jgi:hypothetical protein
MIARLGTQRACLNFARGAIENCRGTILEIGLGKGRTYDYLRSVFPQREIFAFDRILHCPADVRPDPRHLILGDFRTTLREAARRMGRNAALVHADIGSDDAGRDAALATPIAPLIDELVAPGGLIIGDREMHMPNWGALPLPQDAEGWRYYIYRVG